MSWLSIVGIGEDGLNGLGESAKKAIANADVVFGGARHLELAAPIITGAPRQWRRIGDSGSAAIHHFCDTCGTTLFYVLERQPDVAAVALGAFADPHFPPPAFSVYEDRAHPWVTITGDGIVHD